MSVPRAVSSIYVTYLQGEVKVCFCRHEERWDVIQTVLLLNATTNMISNDIHKAAWLLTRRLLMYENEFVSLESYT